jgi:hypothetical protein
MAPWAGLARAFLSAFSASASLAFFCDVFIIGAQCGGHEASRGSKQKKKMKAVWAVHFFLVSLSLSLLHGAHVASGIILW